MSVIAPDLHAQANQIRLDAEMVSECSAAGTTELGGGGHPDSSPPAGLSFTSVGGVAHQLTTSEQVGRILDAAEESGLDVALAAAIKRAEWIIERVKHGRMVVPESRKQFHARICADYEGITAPNVARAERCGVTEVRLARTEHGRSGRFGYKVKAVGK